VVLDPEACQISHHAMEVYRRRRHSRDPEAGARRLLRRAALQPVPPVTHVAGRAGRRYDVGELVLILNADLDVLVTVYRQTKRDRTPLSRQWIRGR
jgi:hypothetical protein